MAAIRPSGDGSTLEVVFVDAPALRIHPLWLRERCRDAASMDAQTQQRLFNPSDVDAKCRVIGIAPAGEGQFDITFDDGKHGRFTAAQILAELPLAPADLPTPVPWTAATPAPAATDWASCATQTGRLAALQDYFVNGYVIIEGVLAEDGAVLQVARCFGYPRETNFGMLFDVRSVPDANDLAYTALPLDPHTDNPYRTPVPGIQLLHCVANRTEGGLSTLVDGHAVADALRARHAAYFDILANIPVRFRYIDASAELVASAPLIELDQTGVFKAIHYSPRLDFVPLLPADTLEQFYAARRVLDHMVKSDRFERRFRLAEGALMMFDNRRLLHGRTGFDPRTARRHLQGCYIDADGPASHYRVLRRRLT